MGRRNQGQRGQELTGQGEARDEREKVGPGGQVAGEPGFKNVARFLQIIIRWVGRLCADMDLTSL